MNSNKYQVFMRRYPSLCLHHPYSSFLKFNVENSGWYSMKTFSTLHSMQKFATGLKCGFWAKIDQLRVWGILFKNKSPM